MREALPYMIPELVDAISRLFWNEEETAKKVTSPKRKKTQKENSSVSRITRNVEQPLLRLRSVERPAPRRRSVEQPAPRHAITLRHSTQLYDNLVQLHCKSGDGCARTSQRS